ncbi:DNA repair protein RecN [Acetatifactor muris]|uniref:DNA repair protein RecN n=1 Tax=Acetatifactor muris TaxID=879566 RepID=A0A2K4ZEH1_9FIRM|nr:DNA repair protein RecN [Acetatifactor muris]MCR2048458.1 DNA repair protein RecN [Acetatifactor muris]SOY28844.1 DNA repair protein RecN [Acetatifactor muris]
MLQSLHVKNLALMEETEVEFGRGLNILTGETGAGKSLLIGSVNLALGGKFEKEMLRRGADSALVELVFTSEDERVRQKLLQLELEPEEDGTVIISRKMQTGKSVYRMNGETVTARQVKELAELLIDIHGQHEHQSLLNKKKHMEILDAYCGEACLQAAKAVEDAYRESRELRHSLEEESMDEETMAREQSLAEFELQEIEQAQLKPGEDEELEQRYRFMINGKKIMENLAESYQYTGSDFESGAGSALSRALRALGNVAGLDERLGELEGQLSEIDSLLADYNRDLAEYMSDCEFDDEAFSTVEERLNLVNRLKDKYGQSIEAVLAYGREKQEMLQKLSDYDDYMRQLEEKLAASEKRLEAACEVLSGIRRENAAVLTEKLKAALVHLNFLTVEFQIAVNRGSSVTAKGYDDVEFLISTNPGEGLKPLGQVASGGELSRVMLAIKTVLAGRDSIDTLIFDEIDAGISGRTAWRVSEQLDTVAHAHQVLCITHLPQIAAMADRHFVIEKSSSADNTITDIRVLEEEESLGELARLLGSDAMTEAALSNAREMRVQALGHKKK